ncbi:Cytochrome P450 alkane hydroxylase [Apiospora phragmitis]|uniref:Cytochrome P450 alkane hydroxylase n=1 Tax=Apiospora phragmitis TaxID=2905665 RepID=A0ABR1VBZ4_9PEZI
MDALVDRKFQEIAKTTFPDPPRGAEDMRRSLLDDPVRYTDDPLELRDAMITVSFSNDSLAGIMAATPRFLSRHEDVYKKLRRSVLDTVGYEEPTYQQIAGFSYLQQVTNELPTGVGPKSKDSLLVKKGQPLVLSTWVAQRHTKNFGDDAMDIRPERWDDQPVDAPGYLPFLIGPRTCSGRK